MRIIGIDPGLKNIGWGVIECEHANTQHIAHGKIKNTKNQLSEQLLFLNEAIIDLIACYQPASAALEKTIVNTSAKDSLGLAQARGAILLTLAKAELSIGEYAPNTIKKAICGHGKAAKSQVLEMIKILLPRSQVKDTDAADALAMAFCHHYMIQQEQLSNRIAAAVNKS